jgi:hypothetical protein
LSSQGYSVGSKKLGRREIPPFRELRVLCG